MGTPCEETERRQTRGNDGGCGPGGTCKGVLGVGGAPKLFFSSRSRSRSSLTTCSFVVRAGPMQATGTSKVLLLFLLLTNSSLDAAYARHAAAHRRYRAFAPIGGRAMMTMGPGSGPCAVRDLFCRTRRSLFPILCARIYICITANGDSPGAARLFVPLRVVSRQQHCSPSNRRRLRLGQQAGNKMTRWDGVCRVEANPNASKEGFLSSNFLFQRPPHAAAADQLDAKTISWETTLPPSETRRVLMACPWRFGLRNLRHSL
jgi:hypothetical protein